MLLLLADRLSVDFLLWCAWRAFRVVPFSVLASMASESSGITPKVAGFESSDHTVLAHVDSRCRLLSLETSL